MRREPTAALSTARVSSPAELALVIPEVLGFTPSESITLASLRQPRGRLGLIQRLDLPPPGEGYPPSVVAALVERVRADVGTGAAVMVWSDEPDADGELPWAGVVDVLREAFEGAGLDFVDGILLREGRWWSYVCDASCCPPGTPLGESAGTPALALVAAERTLSGRAVLGSREELAESVAGVHPLGPVLAVARIAAAAERQLAAREADPIRERAARLDLWRRVVDEAADPRHRLEDEDATELIASLGDTPTRDAVVVLGLEQGSPLQLVLEELCRRSAPPFDAALCTTLAWVAYLGGAGAIVTIALERAEADDPFHSGARLLLGCLELGVPPDELRGVVLAAAGGRPVGPVRGSGKRRRPRRSG